MTDLEIPQQADRTKYFLIPIFLLLMSPIISRIYIVASTLSDSGILGVILLLNHLLMASFYVLLILFCSIRLDRIAKTSSIPVRIIAIAGMLIPQAFSFLPRPDSVSPALIMIANLVIGLGIAFSVHTLAFLGRSFSITPESRRLVNTGPYRLVRHPLYLGEFIMVIGAFLAAPTAMRALVVILHTACQLSRALQEEKILTRTLPEYEEYARQTPRFFPVRLFGIRSKQTQPIQPI